MRTFKVGGAVRDEMMGLTPKDFDYVVEATEEQFKSEYPDAEPVGQSFPVYIIAGDEVALTRKERSTGDGYGDFEVTEVGVPIEDDLGRRDFTINSIAVNDETGEVVDPYNGVQDIKDGIIRTVNPIAFVEDPVRILRGVRFAKRFEFNIESETLISMIKNGHRLTHVTGERIEKELRKVWDEVDVPSTYFKFLKTANILRHVFPDLADAIHIPAGPAHSSHGTDSVFDHLMKSIDRAKLDGGSFSVFIATLVHDFGKIDTDVDILPRHIGHENRTTRAKVFLDRYRFDTKTKQLAMYALRLHMRVHFITKMKDTKVVRYTKLIPKNFFDDVVRVMEADHPLTDEQREMVKFMRIIRFMKFDGERIEASKDKVQEVERQMRKMLGALKRGEVYKYTAKGHEKI